MHPYPENWLAIGRAVMYYARLPTHSVQELNADTVHVGLYNAACISSGHETRGRTFYLFILPGAPAYQQHGQISSKKIEVYCLQVWMELAINGC